MIKVETGVTPNPKHNNSGSLKGWNELVLLQLEKFETLHEMFERCI